MQSESKTLTLTPEEIQELSDIVAHGNPDRALRARIVLSCPRESRIMLVAKETGVTEGTVRRWKGRYLKDGVPAIKNSYVPNTSPAAHKNPESLKIMRIMTDEKIKKQRWHIVGFYLTPKAKIIVVTEFPEDFYGLRKLGHLIHTSPGLVMLLTGSQRSSLTKYLDLLTECEPGDSSAIKWTPKTFLKEISGRQYLNGVFGELVVFQCGDYDIDEYPEDHNVDLLQTESDTSVTEWFQLFSSWHARICPEEKGLLNQVKKIMTKSAPILIKRKASVIWHYSSISFF